MNSTAMALWQPPRMMSLEDLYQLVQSVDLSSAPFKMWFSPSTFQTSDGERSVSAQLSWVVPDRDDPKVEKTIRHWVHLRPGISRDMAVAIIGGAVRTAFIHEMEECFKIGGVRLYDPHPALPTPPITATSGLYYVKLTYTEGV